MFKNQVWRCVVAGVALCAATGQAFGADCSQEASFKSAPGGAPSEVSFRNNSDAGRRLYWIDAKGQRKFYAVVEPGKTHKQATTANHTWVVTDAAEKCLYVVTASSAPMVAEIGGAAAVAPPPVGSSTITAADPASTTAKYGLFGSYQIKSIARPGFALNNLVTGYPELEKTKPDWDSAYWQFEDVKGTPFVLIKNKWKGTYLQDDRGSLRVAPTTPSNEAAHWVLEGASNAPYGRIKNRRDGRYLIAIRSGFDLVTTIDNSDSSYWQLTPIAAGQATVDAPSFVPPTRVPVVTPKRPTSADCTRHQVYNSNRGKCIDKSSLCNIDQVYSSSIGQCIGKAALCESNQVYNSNVHKCVTKVVTKAPKCKYKTDGPGNCLSPAYYKCVADYAQCNKICAGKKACKASCSSRYESRCGAE